MLWVFPNPSGLVYTRFPCVVYLVSYVDMIVTLATNRKKVKETQSPRENGDISFPSISVLPVFWYAHHVFQCVPQCVLAIPVFLCDALLWVLCSESSLHVSSAQLGSGNLKTPWDTTLCPATNLLFNMTQIFFSRTDPHLESTQTFGKHISKLSVWRYPCIHH